MKEEIKETEIKKLSHYSIIYGILLITLVISTVPLTFWIGIYAFIPLGGLFAITLFFAYKIEQIKKENNIHTYKEIVAFTEGKRLDELERQQEKGKWPYQRFLLVIGSGLITFIICMILAWFFI